MTNCTIIGNTASGGSLYGNGQGYVTSSFYGGGAIYSTTGSVITIANSTFTGNTTNGDGGGIYTSGTATVTNSAFTANEAACAGGIFNNGVLTVNNSTFANSTGAFYGGGIWNDSEDAGAGGLYQYATLTVTNSTFSHNAVNGWCSAGGGICGGGNGTITVSNSTFANNSTNGLYNNGGGIYGNMTINNTIVAGNTGYDFSGQITGDHNLIGDGTGITNLAQLGASNIIGTTVHPINPLLGPLQDNGGPTQTMALLPGSPAIDTGSNALIPAGVTTDQRGTGFPRILNGTVDIGAYESTPNFINGQTINFVAIANQTYGVTPITLSATDTSSLPVSFSVISGPATITGSVLTVTGMGNVVVEASQAGNATYAAAIPVDKSFTVSPALLTITANNDGKTYGTLKTFSSTAFTETGLVNGDTITGVTETSTGAATSATVGTYPIVPSAATGTGLNNYTIGYVNGTLTVNPPSLLSLTVTTLADDPIAPISGSTTLRDAITQANSSTDSQEVISFATGLNGTIDLTSGLPALNNNISINGPGASLLTVQRDPSPNTPLFPVFDIVDMSESITVSGMTISGGNAGNNLGGGIYSDGTLTVSNSVFANNNTANQGGGICNQGTLTVSNSIFSNNTAGLGGGINNAGTLRVSNSAFTSNNTVSNGCGSGIYNVGTATISGSTFTNNAGGIGGGILNDNPSAILMVINSTFTDNSEGGIVQFTGTVTATNCTITNNTGDGINNIPFNDLSTLTLNNTIVALNDNDISGQIQPASSNNLIGDGAGITNLTQLAPSNLIGTTVDPIDPMLGLLQNNGGPTETMALLTTPWISPAIDAGNNALAVDANGHQLTTDQRGSPRIFNGTVDIGAYELNLPTPVVNVVDNPGPYTGKPFIATATVNGSSSLEGVTPTLDYQLSNSDGTLQDLGPNAPVNVGTYLVTANFAGSTDYAAATDSIFLEIFPPSIMTPTVTVTDSGGTYNGTAFTATATVNGQSSLEGVTPTIQYEQYNWTIGAWQYLATAPVNADGYLTNYAAVATFAGSTDYAATSAYVGFAITPATAVVSVTPIPVVYNGTPQETASYSAIGVNGVALPSSDLTLNTIHTNAGTYQDSWTFSDPNYVSQSGTVTDAINKANATISVPSYDVVYDGAWHAATGSVTGVNGALSGLTINSTHINAGSYTDSWSFTDSTGNYNNASGTMIDTIQKANAGISVVGYGTFYNAVSHAATGTSTLPGLNLAGTVHTNIGTYTDTWTFTAPNH